MSCFTMIAHDHMTRIEDMQKMRQGHVNAKILNLMTDALPWSETIQEFRNTYFEYKGWAARAFSSAEQTLRLIEANRDDLYLIKRAADLTNPENQDKAGLLFGFEGGKCLEGNLDVLRALYRIGIRHLQFSWSIENQLGHPQTDFVNGLKPFGFDVIEEMNRLGMIIDVTHSSPRGIRQILQSSRKPLLDGHVGVKPFSSDVQNLDDDLIRLLAETGSVAGLHFCSHIVKDRVATATVDDLIDEMEYLKKRGTIDMIALGPDYLVNDDSFKRNTSFFYEDERFKKEGAPYTLTYVQGFEEISTLQNLPEHLARRHFTTGEIEKIMGGNLLRLARECLGE